MTTNTDPVRAHDELRVQVALLRTPEFMAQFDPEKFARQLECIATALASAPQPSFDRRFADMLIGILGDVQDELGFTDEEKLCANGSAEIVSAIRELKERAASAPPSAPVGVLSAIAGQLRLAGAALPAPQLQGTPESGVITGLSIALALVESALAQQQG